ncbi:polysaccharide deacetylase family protein [Micromonospora zhanjiangensis]|uniref:Polysaccharide deacetylase family protein n=1 Tax=Micromonospora zhanjiangensis TaxID=1522057 RepID=A0ABV8KJU0_9ACTN
MTSTRRRLLTNAVAALTGSGLTYGARHAYDALTADRPLPFYGGYASAIHADRKTPPRADRVDVVWQVSTTKKLVALTFDDGPHPRWTPEVLDILDRTATPATFFMMGRNAREHGHLVTGRLDRHEVGNHTWAHHDLAKQTYEESLTALRDSHRELTRLCGREPVLMRPPYGHLAGASLLAANELAYRVVLWSRQMLESEYPGDPAGLARYVVDSCAPGTILLAHDTGPEDRLVAIRGLASMIEGLRGRGFDFVTVSDLLRQADAERDRG